MILIKSRWNGYNRPLYMCEGSLQLRSFSTEVLFHIPSRGINGLVPRFSSVFNHLLIVTDKLYTYNF